jgi:hypothetical protein
MPRGRRCAGGSSRGGIRRPSVLPLPLPLPLTLPHAAAAVAGSKVTISLEREIESLNVAVAAGIILERLRSDRPQRHRDTERYASFGAPSCRIGPITRACGFEPQRTQGADAKDARSIAFLEFALLSGAVFRTRIAMLPVASSSDVHYGFAGLGLIRRRHPGAMPLSTTRPYRSRCHQLSIAVLCVLCAGRILRSSRFKLGHPGAPASRAARCRAGVPPAESRCVLAPSRTGARRAAASLSSGPPGRLPQPRRSHARMVRRRVGLGPPSEASMQPKRSTRVHGRSRR